MNRNSALVMINQQTKMRDMRKSLESKVEEMVYNRHEPPMWPTYSSELMDAYDEAQFGPIRHVYYQYTKYLIGLLRRMREMNA